MTTFDPTYSGNQVLGLGAAPVEIPQTKTINSDGEDLGITINDDGSVDIGPPAPKELDPLNVKFNDNLAEKIDAGLLASLAENIIDGVQADLLSRAEFIANYNKGLELLGLKIEEATTTRTQKRNVSRVGHPLLLEAVVKFQALARAEMLPAIGPCKAMVVGGSTEQQDQLASDFESDMNYFLTQIDKGFYPDFDRGLFALGFGGNLFKKAYHDPIKRMPVSRSIQIEDFIVSENASDLYDATRKTHRFYCTSNEIKKMQLAGAYRDVPISDGQFNVDSTKQKQGDIIGIAFSGQRTQDQEHEIYETYTDIDPATWGIKEKGAESELPLPYIVTVDTSSRTVLAVRRNWREGDDQFCERRRFVHYGLVPSFGFLCLGYLHLLGNQTRALRAIWRILIDAGMFSSFPGGMKARGVRTDTNEIAPGPGEFVDVDIGPFDSLKDAFMMMPYKDVSPVFIQLSELINTDSQRMGGIPDMEVGEGRTHIPVGTMMSLVEQATQTMGSVHKRMHSTFQDELSIIKDLFAEDPKALTRLARKPSRIWEVGTEFSDLDLVPASDPNIPSQAHRVQQATALVTVAQNPTSAPLFDQKAVMIKALRAIGINDWASLLHQEAQTQPPDPAAMAKLGELKLKADDLAFQKTDSQRKAAHELVKAKTEKEHQDQQRQMDLFDQQAKSALEDKKLALEHMRIAHENKQTHAEHGHELLLSGLAEAAQTHRDLTKAKMAADATKEAAKLKPKPAAAKPKAKAKAKSKS